jgi:excisionase family DNA binding protein
MSLAFISITTYLCSRRHPMSAGVLREPILAAGEEERRFIHDLERSLERQASARLVGPNNETTLLPEALYRVLLQAARQLAAGNGVAVLPYHQELTTQQAADLLNVSRPHLVSLLEEGHIPFHRVGTHRRVTLRDLLVFKRQRDEQRRTALQSLVDEAQEVGFYDE